MLNLIGAFRERWKSRLVIKNGKDLLSSSLIQFKTRFLQGDSWSPVGFCLCEVLIGIMVSQTSGYLMGAPGAKEIKLTHSLFIDDFKTY